MVFDAAAIKRQILETADKENALEVLKEEYKLKEKEILDLGQVLESGVNTQFWHVIEKILLENVNINDLIYTKGEQRTESQIRAQVATEIMRRINNIIIARKKILTKQESEKPGE